MTLCYKNALSTTCALTERELEVTRLLAEGKSNKEVGTALSITAIYKFAS
jgi:DNA-binding CsgD family transcriptional regulator